MGVKVKGLGREFKFTVGMYFGLVLCGGGDFEGLRWGMGLVFEGG